MSVTRNGFKCPSTAREAALLYRSLGLAPIPLPPRSKDPGFDGWPLLRLTPEEIPSRFRDGANVAVLNGMPSANHHDVDLDTPEAVVTADYLLPPTGWVFGRPSAPRSHREYKTDRALAKASEEFRDLDGQMLLELRGCGGITVYPPSTHKETGERIGWDSWTTPAEVPLDELLTAVRRVAACTLLARHWPTKGGRQDAFLALAGGLLRGGVAPDVAEKFVEALAAATGDEEPRKRVQTVAQTLRKQEEERKTKGWPALAQLLGRDGEQVISRAREWLGLVTPKAPADWPDPLLLGEVAPVPAFPSALLPVWMGDWVRAEATATQTPPDLAGMLALGVAGAALARKFRVRVRPGWCEPLNLFSAAALLPGERKSRVFGDAIAPVVDFEQAERARLAPAVAEAQSEHRQLEARLKALEGKVGKCDDETGRQELKERAREAAKELACHAVPVPPRLFVDDATPEALGRALAEQGGRILLAAAEGTVFEIIKGRYSEGGKANFDVFLKGHAGDPLRVIRVGRDDDIVDSPALSVALAVQPDVIHGLMEQATLKQRGLLARFLYAIPVSLVGSRRVAAPAVTAQVQQAYRDGMLALWRLEGDADEGSRPAAHWLDFSPDADAVLQGLERWLEPQLAEGEELSYLAGWANKLAGACARIAGILHVASSLREGGVLEDLTVSADIVGLAVRLGRDYLLPHARAAFQLMGSDERVGKARRVWRAAVRLSERSERSEGHPLRVSRRDLHQGVRAKNSFASAEEIDPVLALLVDRYYLRPVDQSGAAGRGHKSPEYEINPKALILGEDALGVPQSLHSGEDDPDDGPAPSSPDTGPVSHFSHFTHSAGGPDRADNVPTTHPVSHSTHFTHSRQPGADSERSEGSERQGPCPHLLVTRVEDLSMVLAAIDQTSEVALDLETTGLDPRCDRARLLSLATDTTDGGAFAYLIDCFAVDATPVIEALACKELVIHNAAFDLGFLGRLGFVPGVIHDTMLYSRLLYAGRKEKHDLAACVKRELGVELPKALQKSNWAGTLAPDQLTYAARDVEVLRPLAKALQEKLAAAGLEKAAEIERRCVPAVAWMAGKGVAVDSDAWRALAERARQDADRLRDEMTSLAPVRPGEMYANWNFDSPADLLKLFQTLGLPVGNTADETLAGIDHPIAAKLRPYREATRRLSTYGTDWLKHVAGDGRVYARWNQLGAEASGRMSCGEPNLQQLPRDKAYRRCVVAPPGRVLVKADYSQIELRIAAKMAGDERMLQAYRDGDDLHTLTARQMTGRQDVTPRERQLAKPVNFGLIYGMGAKSLAAKAKGEYGLEITVGEAEQYRRAFFRTYGGIDRRCRQAGRTGDSPVDTRTIVGRRRLGVTRYTEKLNTPVQGSGADGLKQALALLWERRDEVPGAFPVLAVHDEIVIECERDQAEAAAAWLRRAMVDALAPLIAPIPVEVETKVGATWGEE